MNLDVSCMLTQVKERLNIIEELVGHPIAFTSQTEQETFDRLLRKEAVELNDYLELLASIQQQYNISITYI